MSSTYDMFALLEVIKKIIYKFENQKYLPLSLHNAKTNFYHFRQGTMTNPDYLDKFMNLTDMAESYKGTLHDAAVFKISLLASKVRNMPEVDLDKDERLIINSIEREIYLSCMFVIASDPKRYGRLVEELENDYTKGNNNYPTNMVKSCQLINEYKSWTPRTSLPEVSGQSSRKNRWMEKESSLPQLQKKGHIKTDCTEPIMDNDDTNKKDYRIVKNKSGKKNIF